MVGSSILPVAFHKNKLWFLFGKETTLDDTPGWSDFGGGMEKNETPLESALREGSEELTGFLGDPSQLKKHIKTTKNKIYHIDHHFPNTDNHYHVHIIQIPYDENLPKYYNQNHEFLWKRANKKYLKRTCLFEKINIKWFSPQDILKQRNQFRNFYREISDNILSQLPKIKQFFRKPGVRRQSKKKTRRRTRLFQTRRVF
jgi:8-oxo-dGTP pyrophosphatase MutT (NUDIX family)